MKLFLIAVMAVVAVSVAGAVIEHATGWDTSYSVGLFHGGWIMIYFFSRVGRWER